MKNWTLALAAGLGLSWSAAAAAQDGADASVVEDAEAAIPETDPWELELSLGISGSRGSTDSDSLRAGFDASRETDRNIFDLSLTYRYASEDSSDTENRFTALARNDSKLGDDSPWLLFVGGEYEYNKFQNFEHRVVGAGGLGYKIIEDENATLVVRGGAGYTYSFGDVDDGYPNGLLSLQFETQVTDNQKLVTSVTYLPNFDEIEEYRLISRAAYQIDLNEDGNLSLRLGVENRRDTLAEEESDTDYFVQLVYGF